MLELLGLLGRMVELEERLLDAATAVMGCSPAYFALVVEALADAGAGEGLDPELARELVAGDAGRHRGAAARRATPPTSAAPSPRRGAAPRPASRRSIGGGATKAFEHAVQASLERMRR